MIGYNEMGTIMKLDTCCDLKNIRLCNVYVISNNLVLLYLGTRGSRYFFIKLGECCIKKDNRGNKAVYTVLDGSLKFSKDSIDNFITYIYLNGVEKYFIGSLDKDSLNFIGRIEYKKYRGTLVNNILSRIIEDYIKGDRVIHHRSYCYNSNVFLIRGCEYIQKSTNERLLYLGLQCCTGESESISDNHLFLVLRGNVNSLNVNKKIQDSFKEGVSRFKFDLDLEDLEQTFSYVHGIDLNNYNVVKITGMK